jgi:hypothetical protein
VVELVQEVQAVVLVVLVAVVVLEVAEHLMQVVLVQRHKVLVVVMVVV